MTDKTQTERPLVTFALFAYNQEDYIREAIEGAFAQTYEPLEIILSDDCSSDRTFEIMEEMAALYCGNHKIEVRRAGKNAGLASHVNNVIHASNGRIIVFAAGDDISYPERSSVVERRFAKNQRASFVESGFREITDCGEFIRNYSASFSNSNVKLDDLLTRTVYGFVGAGRAYDLQSLKRFPPLEESCPTEDSTLLLRSLLTGEGEYIESMLLDRRVHEKNLSSDAGLSKMRLVEILRQNMKDIDFALRRNIVDHSTARKAKKSLKQSMSARISEQILSSESKALTKLRTSVEELGILTTLTIAAPRYIKRKLR